MRDGYKVFDSDTHVNPVAEVLERYVDPSFRPRLPELDQYKIPRGPAVDGQPQQHIYRVRTKLYRRILGQAGPDADFTGRGTNWMGTKDPRPGVQDDNAANRVKDMDDEGTDVHFLIPSTWNSVVGQDDVELELGLVRAFHRHMADFCGQFPDRLKGLILASTRDIEEAVSEIRQWGNTKWAVAVMPLLAEDTPADHPDLDPIWRAAAEHDLGVVQHSSTWNPPYFPRYRDLWDNIFLGRLASHPWGAMRFMAAFIGSGIMDRYPDLRMGVLEGGFGWLPFWSRRMDEQAGYVGGTAQLEQICSDYVTGGRFFCSIEMHEGEDMFNMVTSFLGDEVLMFASDYPHSECRFPDSPDHVLSWSTLTNETRRKLMCDNAARFYKQT